MRSILLLLVMSLLVAACSETEKTPSGQEFTYIRKGKGEPGRKGEYILMNMSYQDAKDSVWFTSAREDGNPVLLPILDSIPKSMKDGVREVFQLLRVNDSITFKVRAQELFTRTWQSPVPKGVDSTSFFTFHVGVKEIMNPDRLNEFQREFYEKENARAMKAESEQLMKDTVELDQYLAERNITATKTPEGVRYAITKLGKGEKPNLSQQIRFAYKGMLMDGSVFDESKQPIVYPLSNLIRGWQIAFPNFPVGTKATLYVPSSLGYGPQGSPPTIPANANLIFEVELVGIEK
ncbi:MAG: FKBP-type peptidyl-prolyl cis-trans isomerase [Cyclobacteriaceae bacterium]|nr:FKBP-type peptidyl-prolyl cis-trans isomerase [Cyclobacteriaceae bacterium]